MPIIVCPQLRFPHGFPTWSEFQYSDWLVTLLAVVPLLHPWAALCLADWVHKWASLLMSFTPAASIAPSGVVKANHDEEVRNNSSLISQYLVTKMCADFINSLTWYFCGQPVVVTRCSIGSTDKFCIILWATGGCLTKSSCVNIPHLVLGFWF